MLMIMICVGALCFIQLMHSLHAHFAESDPSQAFSKLAFTSKLALTKPNLLIWQSPSPEYGLEHIDVFSLYYREYFFEKDHNNYLGIIDALGPVIVSVCREKQIPPKLDGSKPSSDHRDSRLRVIIRGKAFSDWRLSFLETTLKKHYRLNPKQKLCRRMVLPYLHKMMDPSKLIKVNSKMIEKQLLKLDELNVRNCLCWMPSRSLVSGC